MMRSAMQVVLCAALVAGAVGTAMVSKDSSDMDANPIRRVVKLLQGMATKVEKEGEDQKVLFDKFMCSCSKQKPALQADIAVDNAAVPQLATDIAEADAKVKQLKGEITDHASDLTKATEALASAETMAEKGKKDYDESSADLTGIVAAMDKAIPAIVKGQGAFLQSNADIREPLLRAARNTKGLNDDDRATVTSFLSDAYAPQSSEILGILRTMRETNQKTLDEVNADEESRLSTYEDLKSFKTQERKICATSQRRKQKQVNDLNISLVRMRADSTRAEESLKSNQESFNDLNEACAKKEKEHMQRTNTRKDELAAIADTVQILGNDDSLELFKKTLASPSFLQISNSDKMLRKQALAAIRAMPHMQDMPELGFVAMQMARAANGNFMGVSKKATEIIDGMIKIIKEKGASNNKEFDLCQKRIQGGDSKNAALEHSVKDLKMDVDENKETIATMSSAIDALVDSMNSLDTTVSEATTQRQSEHASFVQVMSENNAAKDILGVAKNRMNKFYHPEEYKAPPKAMDKVADYELLDTTGSFVPLYPSLVQISAHTQASTKSDDIFRMFSKLMNDFKVQMTEAQAEEDSSQTDYEKLVKDAAAKRAENVKAVTAKQGIKADGEEALAEKRQAFTAEVEQSAAAVRYLSTLHTECDWLLANYRLAQSGISQSIDLMNELKDKYNGAKDTDTDAADSGAGVELVQAGKKGLRGAV